MGKMKLISRIAYYILIAFVLIDAIWYAKTGLSFFSSKLLFLGTICTGLISGVFHIIYLIQAKKYKELKQFFLLIIIMIVGICVLIFLA